MVPRHHCLHVSSLHAKVTIITNTNVKRWLTWGNGRDAKHGLADVGLYAKQVLPNRPGVQMLAVNFLSRSGYDT